MSESRLKVRNWDKWQSYEIKKKEIADQNLSAGEYERRIRALVKEMGI